MTSRRDVLAMLDELIELTTLDEASRQSFKVRAYAKAKASLENDGRDITKLSKAELTAIDGVGKATADKVRELVETGSVAKIADLRARFPADIVRISRINGVGPKTLAAMREHLNIETLDDLRAAIDAQALRQIPGLGKQSEATIARSIDRLGLGDGNDRTPAHQALRVANLLVADLDNLDAVSEAHYAGSLRRMAETVGDVDIVVASDDGPAVMSFVRGHMLVSEVLVSGDTKTSFVSNAGLQVDVRVVPAAVLGAAMLYFTGSKEHNIELRQRAMNQSMTLNEYGLFPTNESDGTALDQPVAAATEADIYHALGMDFVPPPMRQGGGEVGAAANRDLVKVPTVADICGDLHYHSDLSGDGRSSLEDMVAAGAARGYRYLAITDHAEDLTINGRDRAAFEHQRDRIAALQPQYPDMRILWGAELNIGRDGTLDFDQDFRSSFDWTVASVHSHWELEPRQQTTRLVAAISDPAVNAIGHLTARYIGSRPGIEFDLDVVIEALAQFDTALEINGAPQRLDASAEVVRLAVERGVKLVISTDSHHVSELDRMHYGVATAQRAWAPAELVVNTWPTDRFLSWIGSQ